MVDYRLYIVSGFFLNRPLWVSAITFALAIDQNLWFVDFVSYIFTNKFLIGVAKYLTWPNTVSDWIIEQLWQHWTKKATCTHHLWFPLLCWWSLWRMTPKDQSSYPLIPTIALGLMIEFCLSSLSRIFVPLYAMWPPSTGKSRKKEKVYLNINLSYGGWKDVKIMPWIFNPWWNENFGARWYQYLPYQCLVWGVINAILCAPLFLVL